MARRDPRTEGIRVAIYRRMTPEQRLRIALELSAYSVEVVRASVRSQHPSWSEHEAEVEVRRRILPRRTPESVIRGHRQ